VRRRWLALLAILLQLAWAGRIQVLQADRLELHKVGDHELVVLVGKPVKMRLADGRELQADRVEYDRKEKRLLLLGDVHYLDPEGRVIESEQIELYLQDESMDALTVHMQSGRVDLWGPEATRVLGQIMLRNGRFTPCARCGQDPYDYCFDADKVVLYPGDRLIAYGVTVHISGKDAFHLPLLMLHFSKRRPRLQVGNNESDGWFFSADLPYVTQGGLGFTLIRYFQKRGWGFGFDHWGVGAAYEHYRALYLPPLAGAEKGSLELLGDYRLGDSKLRDLNYFQSIKFTYKDLFPPEEKPHWGLLAEYRLKEDGWRHDVRLERRDLGGLNRLTFSLRSAQEKGPDPHAWLSVRNYLDLGEEGPAAARVIPEFGLKWLRGLSYAGWSVKGSVSLGGYYDRTNELNRSARALGSWAKAGRMIIEHVDTYKPRAYWPGFSAYFENRYRGYLYDSGERQIRWLDTLRLGQKWAGFHLQAGLKRNVTEGEAFFARDFLRPVHSFDADASLSWMVFNGLSLKSSGGWDIQNGEYKELRSSLNWTLAPFSLSASHVYDPQSGLHKLTNGRLGLRLGDLSASASSGYDYQRGKYSPLDIRLSYALSGGNVSLKHSHDLNEGRARTTSFSLGLRPGTSSYLFSESYNYQQERLDGRLSAGWGPFSLSFSHATFLTGDSGSSNFRKSSLSFAAAWRQHKLTLIENWNGRLGRFGPGYLQVSSRLSDLRGSWLLSARWHLPEDGDEETYLQRAAVSGGVDLWRPQNDWPGLSMQGGLEYKRLDANRKSLVLKNFGLTAAWYESPHTKLFLSVLASQTLIDDDGWHEIKPRFVVTLDRCCWAMQFSLDAAAPAAKLSFIYGGKSSRFLFDDSGIRLPWKE